MKLSKTKATINIVNVGNDFMYYNKSLTELSLPKLESVGNGFMYWNESLTKLSLPKLESAGNDFMWRNTSLTESDYITWKYQKNQKNSLTD